MRGVVTASGDMLVQLSGLVIHVLAVGINLKMILSSQ